MLRGTINMLIYSSYYHCFIKQLYSAALKPAMITVSSTVILNLALEENPFQISITRFSLCIRWSKLLTQILSQ